MENDVEKKLMELCKDLILKLRGSQGGNGTAIINRDLIQLLHITLDEYKDSIHNEELVSKELVSTLFYTCSRFYVQSKYSRNAEDLLKEFNKLNTKLLMVYGLTS
jgi:hypothetical protein